MKYLLSIFLTISISACGGGDPEPDSPTIEIEIHTVEPVSAQISVPQSPVYSGPPQKSINPVVCNPLLGNCT